MSETTDTPASLPTAPSSEVWTALLGLWRGRRGRIAVIVALYGVAALAALAPPRLFGVLVDRLGAGASADTIALLCGAMIGSTAPQCAAPGPRAAWRHAGVKECAPWNSEALPSC